MLLLKNLFHGAYFYSILDVKPERCPEALDTLSHVISGAISSKEFSANIKLSKITEYKDIVFN